MNELTLAAEPRTIIGKKVSQLRRQGMVPAVVYGPVVGTTIQLSVERKEFDRFFRVNGHSSLFKLHWTGGEQTVFIHEVQMDPVKQTPVHVNFFAPNLRVDLTASVPVVLHNPNPDAEGILAHGRVEIEVRGLPTALPHQIDVDIHGLLAVGDAIRVSDLTMPADIVAITPEDEMIAHLVAETVEEPTEAEIEAAEAAEAAEGEEGAEGTETTSSGADESTAESN